MTTVSISRSASTVHDPGGTVAFVRLNGQVDLAVEPVLTQAVNQLRTLTPGMVVVDLSGITFASSIVAGFFARIHLAVPPSTHVMVHGATGLVRRILELAGTDQFVTLEPDSAVKEDWS